MEYEIDEFRKLLLVAEQLMGPEGCPWDREQTLVSMRSSVLEEACEVIEAIDEDDNKNLIEELGDLLYNVIFFCKLGEKEKRFSMQQVIASIREKLIARHPHVFGEKTLSGSAEVLEQWERLKKEEKKHRESLLDGIPKGLPALARAYKMVKKMAKMSVPIEEESLPAFETEEELGQLLWAIVRKAKKRELQPEHALRKELVHQEQLFRKWEKTGKETSESFF